MKADTVGTITPAILVTLNPGERILTPHGLMLYKEPNVKLNRKTLKSLGVGMSDLMAYSAMGAKEEEYFLVEFEGPGNVTLSRDKGGEARILPLAPGQTVQVAQGHLVGLEPTVRYSPVLVARYQNPLNPNEVQMLWADRLTGPGTIILQGHGNVLSFNLQPGETMRTSVPAFLLASQTVGIQVQTQFPPNPTGIVTRPLTQAYLFGPGTVMLQSGT